MFSIIMSIFLLIACYCSSLIVQAQLYVQPEQVKLSYGGKPGSLFVTWVTLNDTNSQPLVEYGRENLDMSANGTTTKFVDGGPKKREIFVHRVVLTDLMPGEKYIYHVGGRWGWSPLYFTNVSKSGTAWSPRFAVFGDMGVDNAQSLSRLQKETQLGRYDMMLHIGDMAYDLDTNDAQYGDEFSRQIEPIAAYVPYMTVVGNHENAYNFSNYVNRFSMPNGESNHFYSFDFGPAHFVGFSTEFYFYVEYGYKQIGNQFRWLDQDLRAANKNRKKVPWIITMGHRPMYCSNYDSDDCTKYDSIIRTGLPYTHAYALEPLFYKYGVDLAIWAHEHSYERMYPLYNRTVFNVSNDPYLNPVAPVHIVTGSAGCQEKTDPFVTNPPPWSAFRSSQYGFSRMIVHNSTHLYFEQVSDDQGGAVIDSVWIKKDWHGSYMRMPRRDTPPSGHYVPLDIDPPKGYTGKCKKCSHQ